MNPTQRLDGDASDWDVDDIPRTVDAQLAAEAYAEATECQFDQTNSRATGLREPAMTAAVLAQQTDAGHLAGLWAGLALMSVGGVLMLVGGVVAARHLIRWWEATRHDRRRRRMAQPMSLHLRPAARSVLRAGPPSEGSGGPPRRRSRAVNAVRCPTKCRCEPPCETMVCDRCGDCACQECKCSRADPRSPPRQARGQKVSLRPYRLPEACSAPDCPDDLVAVMTSPCPEGRGLRGAKEGHGTGPRA